MTATPIPDDEATLPPIVVAHSQRQPLLALAMESLMQHPREAGALLQEVCRAEIVPDDQMTAPSAGLGARVTFTDGGPAQVVTLVAQPSKRSGSSDLSVLTNLGAGLLGLSPGQSIDWPDRVGGERQLTVIAVETPPADDGPRESVRQPAAPASPPAPTEPGEVVPFRRRPAAPPINSDPPPSAA